MDDLTTAAKTLLEQGGYVVVKARTYRGLQERVRIAEQATAFERETNKTTHAWARQAFDEQRRLGDRLTFVYGEARAAGCTVEQLAQVG